MPIIKIRLPAGKQVTDLPNYKLELDLNAHEVTLFTLYSTMGNDFLKQNPDAAPVDVHGRQLMTPPMVQRARESLREKLARAIHDANACFDDTCDYAKRQNKINNLFNGQE